MTLCDDIALGKHCLRQWFGAVKPQAITRINADLVYVCEPHICMKIVLWNICYLLNEMYTPKFACQKGYIKTPSAAVLLFIPFSPS